MSPSSKEEILVDATEEAGMVVSLFMDNKGRQRLRCYVQTGHSFASDTADVTCKCNNVAAVVEVTPHDVSLPIATFCFNLPWTVYTTVDGTSKTLPASDELVETVLDESGTVSVTFFVAEQAAIGPR